MDKQKLLLEQIDQKISSFYGLEEVSIPGEGWIFSIRTAIKMSLRQLGKKMGITAQSIKEIESREKNGTVSLNVLKQVAQALDMHFVYGFIPKTKSLDGMIEERALDLAKEIVLRTSANMKLEEQENLPDRINKSIIAKTQEIKNEMPRYLWD